MSVDDTIRELSHTLAKLGELVMEINGQVGSISSRINITLQTFDDSISGIAKDANKMTSQVDTTIAQPFSEPPCPAVDAPKLRHIAVEMEHEPRRYGFGPQQTSRIPSGYSSASASAFHQPPASAEYFANGNGVRTGGTCSPSICDIRGSLIGLPDELQQTYQTTKKRKMLL
uniref:Uncharacterized protein n=1 Tax=Meloidogyne javanica TaxID=6303 RepID=A0A915M8F9_MELJA